MQTSKTQASVSIEADIFWPAGPLLSPQIHVGTLRCQSCTFDGEDDHESPIKAPLMWSGLAAMLIYGRKGLFAQGAK